MIRDDSLGYRNEKAAAEGSVAFSCGSDPQNDHEGSRKLGKKPMRRTRKTRKISISCKSNHAIIRCRSSYMSLDSDPRRSSVDNFLSLSALILHLRRVSCYTSQFNIPNMERVSSVVQGALENIHFVSFTSKLVCLSV